MGLNHSQSLTASNFKALWPTDLKFSKFKDLNLFPFLSKFQEACSILRVGSAQSKWPHFDSVYLLRGRFKPNSKKSQQLLNMSRKTLGKLVQFLTGHNKLKRHKNLQDGINDPYSCRLCLEEEESSFHVIAECPATQSLRTKIFDLPTPTILPNPPDWRVSQVARFLKESSIGNMLEQNWYKPVDFSLKINIDLSDRWSTRCQTLKIKS